MVESACRRDYSALSMVDDLETSDSADARAAPALVVGARRAVWVSGEGEIEELALADVAVRLDGETPLVCHARNVARRLNRSAFPALDLLELFAFVLPARFCLPSPRGLARALGLKLPASLEDEALLLQQAADRLLAELKEDIPNKDRAARIAMTMARARWPWGPAAIAALGVDEAGRGSGYDMWNELPAWEELAPLPAPGDFPVQASEARERLHLLLGPGAEARAEQDDYAALASASFVPRDDAAMPNLVLAEAGTGIGKTLGYIAPASLWAERNEATVWISTFTKNLQRQVDQELSRLYPDPEEKRRKVVIRKGRENYLCLLNFQEAVQGAAGNPRFGTALGLLARWALASRDGDMIGGDFPAWLIDLLDGAGTTNLTDRRGECIYSACSHYQKCFIENTRRKAARAEIVVANHALVMIRAALGVDQDWNPPTRYVFDEGHHIFDAADNAFAAHLSGREGAELRRWLVGGEAGRRRGQSHGLENRIGDLLGDLELSQGAENLAALAKAARNLPSSGWLRRMSDEAPVGATERFLVEVRGFVLARATGRDAGFSLEASLTEPSERLLQSGAQLSVALGELNKPLHAIASALAEELDERAGELDTSTRMRIEAAVRGLKRRMDLIAAWQGMLARLDGPEMEKFVDWFALERIEGREIDVGMYRHWVDPTQPFARAVLARAHGVLITSATLRDTTQDAAQDWQTAEVRTGAAHLPLPAQRDSLTSPFDYVARTRIYVVNDVARDNADQVAAAYRELFLASGGGALGLFTAIRRLRNVHGRIAGALEDAGLPLYAQHVDAMDTGTLVDLFRAEEEACLLGSDAVRDGVDVPGRSLRLIVFDRVPWPRPDILHKARRQRFGGNAYDDMLTRLRLKQAYGRLLRRVDDAGVFVMLDSRLPSRLLTAFPDGVEVVRTGLAEAVQGTANFLAELGVR